MGPKMAEAFATIFMDKTKTDMSSINSLNKQIKPTNNQINNRNICFRGYFL